ncbi:MAG: peptide chain release factor 2 [Lentisphaerae bacterium]|nr:peptide chain release factor 2 [Lentisphaerota bacterium]
MTKEELQSKVTEAAQRLDHLRGYFDVALKSEKLELLEARMGRADFWDSRESSQAVVAEVQALKNVLGPYRAFSAQLEDFQVLAELAELEGDDSPLYAEAAETWPALKQELERLELVSFLSGKMDKNNAILTIHAGAGGTESCDWCGILLRMYSRWLDEQGYSYETADLQPGDEAGVKYVTLTISGDFAYGYLKAEKGVHRLVRISPFDSNKRRHTSFCSVDVLPEVDDDIDIVINDGDLRIDTYRASGAGGQHVNRTDSAVRLTHLESGIVVTCQNERSQHKNKATAMRILKARLYEREEEKRRAAHAAESSAKGDNAWGNQIRSYVLQPYQLVKDLRTDSETSNVSAVLDGDIDQFIHAYLRAGLKP